MELKFSSPLVYQIRYHMVLCLKAIFLKIGERYWFEFEEIGTDGDHVHIFIGAAPKYTPSRVMQIIKSISAREMFSQFPELRKQLWGGSYWSDGGYIGTVGDGTTVEIVKKYIQEQGSEKEREQYSQLKLFKF